MTLEQHYRNQQFANGYQFVNGIEMHAENGERFQIPPPVLKKHIQIDHFVELRIDSPRFSAHEDALEKFTCSTCNGEATKPVLSHDHPASLLEAPKQDAPSRGWGEDFWVKVTDRDGTFFSGVVDNPLYEARLHEVHLGDTISFHEDHILAIHSTHRQDLVRDMEPDELKQLARWLDSREP